MTQHNFPEELNAQARRYLVISEVWLDYIQHQNYVTLVDGFVMCMRVRAHSLAHVRISTACLFTFCSNVRNVIICRPIFWWNQCKWSALLWREICVFF